MVRPSKIFAGQKRKKIALADTKMSINGCQVLMGHPDPNHAQSTAIQFKGHLESAFARASCVTMGDFYDANTAIYKKLELGESLWN
jgi:hypothetical protein